MKNHVKELVFELKTFNPSVKRFAENKRKKKVTDWLVHARNIRKCFEIFAKNKLLKIIVKISKIIFLLIVIYYINNNLSCIIAK